MGFPLFFTKGNNFCDFLFAFSDYRGVYSANRVNDNFSFTNDWQGCHGQGNISGKGQGKVREFC